MRIASPMQHSRTSQGRRRTALYCATLLLLGSGCRRATRQSRTAANAPPRGTATPPIGAATSGRLTIDSLPAAARQALAAQAPDFQVWTPENYVSVAGDSAHALPAGGSAVVQAHFRSPTAADYALLGYDRRLRGLRIVGVLVEPNGGFRVIGISDGPERANSLAARPNRYLTVDSAAADDVGLLVKPLVAGPAFMQERFVWVAARGQFLLDEPD